MAESLRCCGRFSPCRWQTRADLCTEANKLTKAARYERNEQRQGYRSDHYNRNLTTTSGNVTLKVSELKGISFETAIIERFRRQESSAEEAHIEMYLAGVSARRVEDIYKCTFLHGVKRN